MKYGDEEKPRIRGLRFAILTGFYISLIWAFIMGVANILYFFGYQIPEILVSMGFSQSALGFFTLQYSLRDPVRKGDKYWKLAVATYLLMGVCTLFVGILNVVRQELNIFTYLCFIIGAALILLSIKPIRAYVKNVG